jgi:hypothetical protein
MFHTQNFANAAPCTLVTFGTYPQTAEGTDSTPITWRVLQNNGGELLLLSEYILDCKRYHHEAVDITWRDCDLRKWLNDNFYKAAFTADERVYIKNVHCTNNGEGRPDTDDKVFLLSVDQIQTFTDPKEGSGTTIRRRTIGTEYAKVKKPDGCSLYVYDKGIEKDYIVENGKKLGCSWWWTRSQLQPEHPSRATFIGARNNIKRYGQVDLRYYGVRPAIQMSTNSSTLAQIRYR